MKNFESRKKKAYKSDEWIFTMKVIWNSIRLIKSAKCWEIREGSLKYHSHYLKAVEKQAKFRITMNNFRKALIMPECYRIEPGPEIKIRGFKIWLIFLRELENMKATKAGRAIVSFQLTVLGRETNVVLFWYGGISKPEIQNGGRQKDVVSQKF